MGWALQRRSSRNQSKRAQGARIWHLHNRNRSHYRPWSQIPWIGTYRYVFRKYSHRHRHITPQGSRATRHPIFTNHEESSCCPRCHTSWTNEEYSGGDHCWVEWKSGNANRRVTALKQKAIHAPMIFIFINTSRIQQCHRQRRYKKKRLEPDISPQQMFRGIIQTPC